MQSTAGVFTLAVFIFMLYYRERFMLYEPLSNNIVHIL